MKFKTDDAFPSVSIKLETKKEVSHLLDIIHSSKIKSGISDDLSAFLTDILENN
jgi:hypothetical protein